MLIWESLLNLSEVLGIGYLRYCFVCASSGVMSFPYNYNITNMFWLGLIILMQSHSRKMDNLKGVFRFSSSTQVRYPMKTDKFSA